MCTTVHISKHYSLCSHFLLCPPFPESPHLPLPSPPLPRGPYLLICSSHEGRTAPGLKDARWRWVQHMLLCSTTCEISMETVQLKIYYAVGPLCSAACSSSKYKSISLKKLNNTRHVRELLNSAWSGATSRLSVSFLFIDLTPMEKQLVSPTVPPIWLLKANLETNTEAADSTIDLC